MVIRKNTLSKKTKAEIIDEHIELTKELDALRAQVAKQAARPAAAIKEATAEVERVTAAVADVTPESAARSLTEASLEVNRALNAVQEQLTSEVATLDNTRKAIAIATQRIKDLHGIDVAATSLAELIDEIDTRRAEFEEFITRARAEYEADVAAREAEQEQYETDLAEERKREQANYDYNLRLQRRKSEDDYARVLDDNDRARKLRIEEEDRERARVAAELTERQHELDSLREQVGNFDARIDAAIEQARADTKVSVERSAGFKAQLAAKEHEATVGLLQAKVESLTTQVADAAATISKLQAELAAANERNTNLATQALKSAEGQTALAELRGFASRGDNSASGKRN